ncbi:hypothetical protein WJX72_010171 [[Myrmecia] bisecta]|uniref:indole-3-glycerol-phosphate synthase n=1 Tax=[Myrmecia] bisecta TaxID=41462 RepID=A0AAW1R9C8_9CHLO
MSPGVSGGVPRWLPTARSTHYRQRRPPRWIHLPRCSGADEGGDEQPSSSPASQLTATLRRKQGQIKALLDDMGMEALEERLQGAGETPAHPPYRLSTLIQDSLLRPAGRPVLLLEVSRAAAPESAEAVGKLAAQYVTWGADAIVVRTDLEDTPGGMADLFAVIRAVKGRPVLIRDWMLHPIQVVEAKEAGAAGVLGTIASVLGNGTAIMSSYAASLGLDAPVEVVNRTEIKAMEQAGVPFFGINLAVKLSLALPNFSTDMAKGLLGDLPFGASSLVGARNKDEAVKARLAGADAILIKQEMLAEAPNGVKALMQDLMYALSGDD